MPNWHSLLSKPWLLAILPLLFFPLMINVRVFPFIAPNEEPKWALLVLCGLLIAVAFAIRLWKQQEANIIRLHWSVLALAGFYLLLALGVWIGPNTTEGMIRFAFWVSCLAVWLSVIYAQRNKLPGYFDVLCWLVSIGSLVFSIRYWFSYVLDYGKANYNIAVLFSPIGHINFTGDVLIILVPAIAWMLAYHRHPVLRILNWITLYSMFTMLLVASSRGALGGLILGIIVLAFIGLRHYKLFIGTNWREASHFVPVLLLLSCSAAAIVTNYNLPYHYRDLARVSGTMQASTEDSNKALTEGVEQPPLASFWNDYRPMLSTRTPIYGSSTAMLADAPWLGQGTGNFFTVYPAYSNRFPDFRDPLSSARTFTTNPHNMPFQIATQNGLPALFLFCAVLLFFWFRLMASVWKKWDQWQAAGVVAITAALFDSMFNHVFFNPASMFVFAMLGALWWSAMPAATTNRTLSLPKSINRPLAGAVLIVAVMLSIWPARWVVSEWHAGYAMAYMRVPDQAALLNQKAYAWDKDNFRAVFGVAQAAYQQRRFDDAIEYLKHFESIYPYNAPALNMLAAAYMVTGRFPEAEATLQRVLKILPDFQMALQNMQRVQGALQQQKSQLEAQKRQAAQSVVPKSLQVGSQ